MSLVSLDLINEIDVLWEPVYPYLAQQIHELYGRQNGNILEIGPFCGMIFTLQRKKIGRSFLIATFPPGVGNFLEQKAKKRKVEEKIKIIETDSSLKGLKENKIDLAIFRGAFFFPSLFKVSLSAIYRILRPKGIAFVGGGFGKYTPKTVIQSIGKRSRDLNLQIGKIEVNEDQVKQMIKESILEGKAEIISEGGLWVLMRK
jgi:ubiquinone/menaquinone biosynthesis C-methylase UbiE